MKYFSHFLKFGQCDFEGVENAGNGPEGIGPSSRLPELHESMDPEPTKRKGRYNLRTSLAWDTAFFTSAGTYPLPACVCALFQHFQICS